MSLYKQGHGAYLTMNTTTNTHVNKLYHIISDHPMSKYLSCGIVFGKFYEEYMTKYLGTDYRTAKTNARIMATKHIVFILNDIGYRLDKNWIDIDEPLPTFEELFPHNQYSKPK